MSKVEVDTNKNSQESAHLQDDGKGSLANSAIAEIRQVFGDFVETRLQSL